MSKKVSDKTEQICRISSAAGSFNRLYEIIATLRSSCGCPWDKAQTPESMRRFLVEEVFEAVDAISSGDTHHAREELGDVLFNTLLTSFMYEQSGTFSIADILDDVSDKMVRRHPHVFPESDGSSCMDGKPEDTGQVISQWEKIKEQVEGRGAEKSVLDEVPAGFPPVMKACKYQHKAAKLGFEWNDASGALDKLGEELGELQDAVMRKDPAEKESVMHEEEEAGDFLFSAVNYVRYLGIDPSVALSRANSKFYSRFSYVEQHMKDAGIPFDREHEAEMDAFWKEAKDAEKSASESGQSSAV